MSIDRQFGKIIVVCDECDDQFETGESQLVEALDVMRNDPEGEKWEHQRSGDMYTHLCPDCKTEIVY